MLKKTIKNWFICVLTLAPQKSVIRSTVSKLVRGFTFVEVLISVSLFALFLSVVMFNYPVFTDNIILGAAGQEVSIAVREAQTYALAVKEASAGGGQFSYAYGINFNPKDNPTEYYVFVDKDADKYYDVGLGACGSATTECVEKFSLPKSISISQICNSSSCYAINPGETMNITFLRPSPNASINYANNGGNLDGSFLNDVRGKVILSSPKGRILWVIIESTGQVLVQPQ
ncbi:MAG: prepilin-type N-terminal cleavage/methylation domain-containing protein [Minisyncoccia bacterium]